MNPLKYSRFSVSVLLLVLTTPFLFSTTIMMYLYYWVAGLPMDTLRTINVVEIFKEEFEEIKNNTLT